MVSKLPPPPSYQVSSPLFADKKKCTCSVGSVEELTAALQQSLGLQGQRIGTHARTHA